MEKRRPFLNPVNDTQEAIVKSLAWENTYNAHTEITNLNVEQEDVDAFLDCLTLSVPKHVPLNWDEDKDVQTSPLWQCNDKNFMHSFRNFEEISEFCQRTKDVRGRPGIVPLHTERRQTGEYHIKYEHSEQYAGRSFIHKCTCVYTYNYDSDSYAEVEFTPDQTTIYIRGGYSINSLKFVHTVFRGISFTMSKGIYYFKDSDHGKLRGMLYSLWHNTVPEYLRKETDLMPLGNMTNDYYNGYTEKGVKFSNALTESTIGKRSTLTKGEELIYNREQKEWEHYRDPRNMEVFHEYYTYATNKFLKEIDFNKGWIRRKVPKDEGFFMVLNYDVISDIYSEEPAKGEQANFYYNYVIDMPKWNKLKKQFAPFEKYMRTMGKFDPKLRDGTKNPITPFPNLPPNQTTTYERDLERASKWILHHLRNPEKFVGNTERMWDMYKFILTCICSRWETNAVLKRLAVNDDSVISQFSRMTTVLMIAEKKNFYALLKLAYGDSLFIKQSDDKPVVNKNYAFVQLATARAKHLHLDNSQDYDMSLEDYINHISN
tara:strand:- start:427 stop:2058 length:1632 start_codon:yes stop_codon:yes gene_type:complete